MSGTWLDELGRLKAAATPSPWYVRDMDDNLCMGAIAIGTEPDHGKNEVLVDGAVFGVLAATLIQDPPYITRDDERERENADLIVAMRNAMPDLLRLARRDLIALEQEQPTPAKAGA